MKRTKSKTVTGAGPSRFRVNFRHWTGRTLVVLIGILAVHSPGVAASDAAPLNGIVTDQKGAPLMGVSVTTDVAGVGTQTDSTGLFTLTRLTEVTLVAFSSVGYEPRQFKLKDVPPTVVLSSIYYRTQDIAVTANRAQEGVTPVAFSDFSQADMKRDYKIGEFPLLLGTTPNLYSYSDGGGALGYSYMSIRGFDDKRITTYINGVPLNDPEDQATYFVDLPDFASTVTDIQVQRGVGNSLYGDASFGGSVNIVTNSFVMPRQVKLTSGYGQYRAGGSVVGELGKQSLEYSSGLIDSRWQFGGRFSKQRSGGYRENSWYDGWAYYFSVARLDPRMTTELQVYGGPMHMHLAYNGATREAINADRRSNIYGYSNETDNFNQPHYQLHNVYKLSDKATLDNTLYYIRGRGYYEQMRDGQLYRDYNIDSAMYPAGDSMGSVVRQQWVDKNQTGLNSHLDIDHAHGKHSIGGSFYYFSSDHWGQVAWAQNISGPLDPLHKYYQYYGRKWVGSLYGQELYNLIEHLSVLATAQIRYQRYKFDQDKMGAFAGYHYDLNWFFFSPRLGLNYAIDDHTSVYANAAVSSRTPTDAEIYDAGDPTLFPSLTVKSRNVTPSGDTLYTFGSPTAKDEHVLDLEIGAHHRTDSYAAGINFFWMDFRNEILSYGGINPNNGVAMTINADRSVHAGIELTGELKPTEELHLSGNFSINYNRVKKYSADFAYTVDSVAVDTLTHDTTHHFLDESTTVDFKGKKLSGFPEYLGSIIGDYLHKSIRLTYRQQFVGRQWMELVNIKSLSLDPHMVSSVSASVSFPKFLSAGTLTLSARVDNLFNSRFETSGYGGNYAYRNKNEPVVVDGWAEYYVAAERNFYTQVELAFF